MLLTAARADMHINSAIVNNYAIKQSFTTTKSNRKWSIAPTFSHDSRLFERPERLRDCNLELNCRTKR